MITYCVFTNTKDGSNLFGDMALCDEGQYLEFAPAQRQVGTFFHKILV